MKQQGQSLVEMAIIAPILIFMLLGVFEVGWALRGYLILTNANREAARYAVRQNYLDFESAMPAYETVVTHALESISGQLYDLDFKSNGTMIISYLVVSGTCTGTITVATPLDVPTYTWKSPISSTRITQVDYQAMASKMALEQRQHSCDQEHWDLTPRPDGRVIVEMWYEQPQLFGFPILSNPFTDPVPMYASTTFRKIQEQRFKP